METISTLFAFYSFTVAKQFTGWEEVSFFILQFKIKVKNVKSIVKCIGKKKLKFQERKCQDIVEILVKKKVKTSRTKSKCGE